MTIRDISVCPSTLTEGHSTYSKAALRNLFDGSKVSHFLDFTWEDDNDAATIAENARNLSISITERRANNILNSFTDIPHTVDTLIDNSFLFDDKTKRLYRRIIAERTSWFIRQDK